PAAEPARSATPPYARRASAVPRAARERVDRAHWRAAKGPAATFPTGRIPSVSARTKALPPAGWTGSATVWAPAANTRSAPRAEWIRAAWGPSGRRDAATWPARARQDSFVRAARTRAG